MKSASTLFHVINAAWRRIDLEISHPTGRFAGFDHIEVLSAERVPLPITETGYRSLFILPERIAEIGTSLDYVLVWLEHEDAAIQKCRVGNSCMLGAGDDTKRGACLGAVACRISRY